MELFLINYLRLRHYVNAKHGTQEIDLSSIIFYFERNMFAVRVFIALFVV